MTKPTYSELEAENLRVRGLLQRGAVLLDDLWRTDSERKQVDAWIADAQSTFSQSSSLVSQGEESADIGKLDTAHKSGVEMGKVNRVEEKADREMAYRMECYQCKSFLGYASPSGRGENVAALMFLCQKCSDGAWPMSFEDAGSAGTGGEKATLGIDFCRLYDSYDGHSNHCKVRGVPCDCGQSDLKEQWNQYMESLDGAEPVASEATDSEHTGNDSEMAESREPEKLNNAHKCARCGEILEHWQHSPEEENPHHFEPAESSLSSPPPKGKL